MEHQPFVYGLYDPAEVGHIRYVGMAPSNPSRPYQHAKRAQKDLTDDSYLMHWIRKIQAEGREPSVMILEQLREGTGRKFLGFVESCYIKSLRQIGHRLTNENDGGWGGSNGPHSEETRAKMRAGWTPETRARVGAAAKERNTGTKLSEWTRAKQSKAHQGLVHSEETRLDIGAARRTAWDNATLEERAAHAANVSAAKTGTTATDQTKEILSIAQTAAWARRLAEGYTVSDQHRARNSAAQLGRKQSEETKAKRSASLKAAWARRKAQSS